MDLFSIPNLITLTRLLAIPFIVYFYTHEQYGPALFVMIYAAVSDLVDGALARFLGQRSKLGAILDPAADKTLMLVGFLTLAFAHQIPWGLAFLVILRDLYIVVGVFILKLKCKKVYIRPTHVSKTTTFFQLSVLFLCFFKSYLEDFPYSWMQVPAAWLYQIMIITIFMAALLTLASGLHYTLIGIAIWRRNDAPHPHDQ